MQDSTVAQKKFNSLGNLKQFPTSRILDLELEMQWLSEVIKYRIDVNFTLERNEGSPFPKAPKYSSGDGFYFEFLKTREFTVEERIVLGLAVAPLVKPEVLDVFFSQNQNLNRCYTEFGGHDNKFGRAFLPTIQTALFLIAGNNINYKMNLLSIFDSKHFFQCENVLNLDTNIKDRLFNDIPLKLSREFEKRAISSNGDFVPDSDFPAQEIHTKLDWEDLIVNDTVREQILSIEDWLMYGETLLQDPVLGRITRSGYRALFYGPPGTGKSLTASILGKRFERPVYRIDLTMVVSKYIGETEKNLGKVFDTAEHKNWILFFDEADALFSKRGSVSNSNDRHANQEVAFLLQRIENFNGLIILASNLKDNLDEAFCRRFQSMIYFSNPGVEEREQIWNRSFSRNIPLDRKVNLREIAKKYELSGGSITNVIRGLSLAALKKKKPVITEQELLKGVRLELHKEGVGLF